MLTNSLNRLTGLVTILGGAVVIVFNGLLIMQLVPSNLVYPGYLTLNMLLVFTLTALYIYHLERSRLLLHLGYGLSAISLFLSIGFDFYATFAFPTLQAQFPEAVKVILSGSMNTVITVSMIIGLLGNLMFFIAMLVENRVPRWISGVLIGGTILGLAMLPYNLSTIIVSFGLVFAGYTMITSRSTQILRAQVSAAG